MYPNFTFEWQWFIIIVIIIGSFLHLIYSFYEITSYLVLKTFNGLSVTQTISISPLIIKYSTNIFPPDPETFNPQSIQVQDNTRWFYFSISYSKPQLQFVLDTDPLKLKLWIRYLIESEIKSEVHSNFKGTLMFQFKTNNVH